MRAQQTTVHTVTPFTIIRMCESASTRVSPECRLWMQFLCEILFHKWNQFKLFDSPRKGPAACSVNLQCQASKLERHNCYNKLCSKFGVDYVMLRGDEKSLFCTGVCRSFKTLWARVLAHSARFSPTLIDAASKRKEKKR
mmetsp:Transcript_42974/g.69010  ORF Transcript_42974/g.69010 Transcript_42974/m.69010 type:complete len:140 (-) Transcript_42974:2250-2669(-)